MEGKILQFNQLRISTEYIVSIADYVQLNHMKETKKEKNKYPTFVNPDGSYWFDLSEQSEKYYNYFVRDSLGGSDAIHKIKYYGNIKNI